MAKAPKVLYCGVMVSETVHPVSREFYFIRGGGQWKNTKVATCGKGLFYHYKEAIRLIWPEVVQHRWFDFLLKEWLSHKYVGVMGPKNSGKTHCAAIFHLLDYYAWPECTTVLCCSTTKEMLENRIWGEVKKFHRLAKRRVHWLPGNLIEGRQRIVTDDRDDRDEGRDFRNGLMGIPLKKGNQYVGIGDIIGIKNKRKRLVGDELQCLPKGFIDSTANFMEPNADCKVTGLGNPAQTTDSLGLLCEPAADLGGWDVGIDQTPITKAWRTRFDGGICVQLPGSHSPNMDEPESVAKLRGSELYPFLMTREQMAADAKTWGKEDWHYLMFNEGRMPRGQGSNRVITRQLCITHQALESPIWHSQNRTWVTALDAAYRAVGGDRCVLMRLCFGHEPSLTDEPGNELVQAIVNQRDDSPDRRQIIALVDTLIVPIKPNDFGDPEDQIVAFVKKQHEAWNIPPANHFFDAGMKTSLVSAYSRLWSTQVNTVDFGGKPSERKVSHDIDVSSRDYYFNFVTELWYASRLAIEARQVRGLNEDMILEGCAREFMRVGANKIQVEPKADMKEKTGRSPDLFDTFVLGIEGARRLGFQIRKLGHPVEVEQDNRWRKELRSKAAGLRGVGQLNHSV